MRISCISLALIVALFVPAIAPAQPLADRVPAGALLYVGWTGSQQLGPAYQGSHLKAIADASDVHKLFSETLPQLSARIAQQAGAGDYATLLSAIGSRISRHPSAFYWGGVDFTNVRDSQPSFGLICDAGEDAPELIKDLQTAIDRAGKTSAAMKVSAQEKVVVLTIGPSVGEAPADKLGARDTLADRAAFKDALAKVHEKPIATIYLNIEGIVKLIDNAPATRRHEKQQHEQWLKISQALGLAGAKSAIWTGAFDGKDWSSRAFLAAPAPRAGVYSMMDGKPVSDDVLKFVPETATMVAAGTFDPAKLVADIRTTAAKLNADAPAQIDQGLDRIRTMTGLDLQKDVLEPLGEQWACYSDPTVGGNYSFTTVLMNKLDDPAKAEKSLAQMGRSVTNFLSGQMAGSGMALTMRDVKDGDLTIYFVGTPIVRPAWAVQNGMLYVGLYPQVVSAAARASDAASKGKSILQNASFAAVRTRLGDQKATSIRFLDLPRSAPANYPAWLFMSGYTGFADMFGVPAPAMLLPPLDKLLAQLTPAGNIAWVDDHGWHMNGVSPFPGSELLGSDPTLSVATPALLTSILLPSLNRARETANRVKCASNQRQIGQAILLYANDNKGKYPPDLGTLLKTQDITAEVFVCPSSENTVPPEIKALDADAQAAWVNANASYVYVGQGMNFNAPADTIVLYELSDNHEEDGMNFLYGDGHVEWQSMPVAEQLIKALPEKK